MLRFCRPTDCIGDDAEDIEALVFRAYCDGKTSSMNGCEAICNEDLLQFALDEDHRLADYLNQQDPDAIWTIDSV